MASYIASAFVSQGGALNDITDIVEISGSATKVVTVHEMSIGVTTIQALSLTVAFIKRSSAGVGGGAVVNSILPHQTSFPPATAVVNFWGTAPSPLGTEVGILDFDFADHLGATVSPSTKAKWSSNVPGTPGILLTGTSEFLVGHISTLTTPFTIGFVATIIWSED